MGNTNVYIGDVSPAFDHRLRRAERQIEALQHAVVSLRQQDNIIMSAMDDLEAQMDEADTKDAALRAYVERLEAEMKAAGVTDARVMGVLNRLKAQTQLNADATKIFANVPPTPEQPPADPNAPPA